jgi:hypothetical protein
VTLHGSTYLPLGATRDRASWRFVNAAEVVRQVVDGEPLRDVVRRAARQTDSPLDLVLDGVAVEIAQRFLAGTLDYDTADSCANAWWSVMLDETELPSGFAYPTAYLAVVQLGLIKPSPWLLELGDDLREWQRVIESGYPGRNLVFCAIRQGSDLIACFDGRTRGMVVFEDFQGPMVGGRHWDTFRAWFSNALAEMFDEVEFGEGLSAL